jgi:hypothetical protein
MGYRSAEADFKRAEGKAEKVPYSRQRFWLVVAALWLQVMVVAFIVVEIKHRVNTPVTQWVRKALYLLGLVN